MSNYDRRDRQDETAMWDAEEVRRQESAQQSRRSSGGRKRRNSRTGLAIYLVCVVLGSCLLAGIGWLLVNDLCSLNKAPVEVEITVEEGDSLSDVATKLKDAGLVNSKGFSSWPAASCITAAMWSRVPISSTATWTSAPSS